MRHIKIYEDYTDEELRDLQDVLHDVGHDTRWTFGEDFGFGLGPKFSTEITGGEFPSISREFFKHLLRKGDIVTKGSAFGFKNPKDFGIGDDFDSGIDTGEIANRHGIHIRPKDYKRFTTKEEMAYAFDKIIRKLGEIRK
jgi:hypothetical protein